MAENKMEAVAKLFGKKLGERFTIKRYNDRFDCCFMQYGLETFGAYENPYMSFNVFILQELFTGTAVIVDD